MKSYLNDFKKCKGITVLSLGIACGLFPCGGSNVDAAKDAELVVFAAASMTETLTQLGNLFMEEHDNVNIIFNFDSSGTLKTQIEEGAQADVFISAGQKQMDQLDIQASVEVNTDGLDHILEGSRIDLLENKVALTVPEGNPSDIRSYDDMVSALKEGRILLAIGNPDVPVGQYAQQIFASYGIIEEDLIKSGCITYGSNAREVTTQVEEAIVDCGIIYQTDAFSAGLTIVDTATEEMCGQVIYPAAVIKDSENMELAQEFLEYLSSEEADAVFEEVGFTTIDLT